ncbi:ankyrin repeat-containing domain protein [Podospora conica]|nr:ankyrin repeat-containing domain protein [Schizothecium conicum]
MRVAERMRPLVDFMSVLGSFASALDAAVPGAGLALNSIKGVFLASKARLDLQDYLVELVVDKISANLPLVRRYRDEFQHSPELMSAALDIYGDVLDIGNRATRFFYDEKGHKRHSLWILAASNWSSCKDDLEAIRHRFDSHLENFGRAALFAHAQDTRVGIQLLLEDGERNHRRTQAGLQLVLEEGKQHHRDTRASLERIVAGTQQQEAQLSQLESGLSEQTRMLIEDKSERGRELDSLQAKNRRELLRWIATQTSKLECAAIHDKLQRAAVPRTGDWLLNHPLFQDWSEQRGPGGLWISGKWGTGKSVLASNIIRRLLDRCRKDDSMACAYMYCSSEYPFLSSDANKNADVAFAISYKRVLGSLLHQLYGALPLDQDLDSLVTLWGQGASLLEVHVEEAIRDVIPMFQQAFVVIDGLDEFQRTDDGEFAVLCEFIGTLVGSGSSILILSRPEYVDISNAMSGTAVIHIDGKANEDDIIAFVHEQTSRLGRMGRYEEQIREELVTRANGVFRWISAVVSYIRHIKTPRARAEAVKTMPPHLKDVYAKTLERILNQTDITYNYAVMALLWVTHACRGLTVKEMTEALSIEPGMTSIDDDDRIDPGHVDELCENCQGFLELGSNGQYQLPHDSVRDFLVGPPDTHHQGLEAFWTLRAQSHERIAEACLTYLSLDVFGDVKVTSHKQAGELHVQYPLLRYASHHWGDHLAKLGNSVPPQLDTLVRAFLESDNRRELNLQLLRDDDVCGYFGTLKSRDRFVFRCARSSVPLHLVAWFGLEHFLPGYFSDEAFRTQDGFNLLPIEFATLQDKQPVFDWMLGHYKPKSELPREVDGGSPNHSKSDTSKEISPRSDGTSSPAPFSTLLLLPYALASRETWVKSLRKVLELGFDANAAEPTRGYTPLHAAAYSANVDGVKVLLEMGADPGVRCLEGQTPFLIAAFYRQQKVARALFDHGGFDISAVGLLGFNALHYFAEYDHALAAEFLDGDGRMETSTTGRTPLHFAASASNADSARVLCRWLRGRSEKRLRLELDKKRSDGITALQVAAINGSVNVAKVLVEEFGDDLMRLTTVGETFLHLAAMSDEPKMIDFVIERCGIDGIDPNAQTWTSDSATALHIAIMRGHANFATAMLKAYPNLNTGLQDRHGRVPLYSASLTGDVKMVEMLKDFSYDVPNREGSLPFHCSVRSGNLECVKILYRPDILERPISTGGQTALHDAAAKGHADIVRFLLAVGHQHDLRDSLGRIPLHLGVLFGNRAVVSLLLECGSDVRCLDNDRRTPLSNAFWLWPAQPTMVALLLGEERELLNLQDEYGRNCALICAARGTPELWAKMWPRGYVGKGPDLTGQSPVWVAANLGNLPMLEYLVGTDGLAFDDPDICSRTPLSRAVKNGFTHVVKN